MKSVSKEGKTFTLSFPEVIKLLKKHPNVLVQGDGFQEGCVVFIDPFFGFFSAAVYYKEKDGSINKLRDSQFLMSVEVFEQNYRVVKGIEEIF